MKIEVHQEGNVLVGELTTDHAMSSHGIPVFVDESGAAHGVADLLDSEIRVRDPKDLPQVEEWLADWPQFQGAIRVSHGGPRGGPRKWSGKTVRRSITFRVELWQRLQARAKRDGVSAPKMIERALETYLDG